MRKEEIHKARAISNKNVMRARFETVDFDGEFLSSFGKPELRGAWMVFGGSGTGKTTFLMMGCKYLTRFGKVAYDSLEQGLSLSLQRAWERVGMSEVGNKITLLDREDLAGLISRLKKKKSPDIIVIDSLQYLLGFTIRDYLRLRLLFPSKLFIFVSHERNGQPDGVVAQKIRYDADIKIRTLGYKAFFTTRYQNGDEGGADFTIWEKGARDYWCKI